MNNNFHLGQITRHYEFKLETVKGSQIFFAKDKEEAIYEEARKRLGLKRMSRQRFRSAGGISVLRVLGGNLPLNTQVVYP